jgi:hypothetical protein
MAGGSRQSVNQAIGSFANRGWLRTEAGASWSPTCRRCAGGPVRPIAERMCEGPAA